MKLTGDYHTHTNYTHGTGSVEDSVRQAEKIGLRQVAITEHSYKGWNHIKPGDLPKIKHDIEEARSKYSVDVLYGIEANLMSRNGDIDISDEELKDMDIVVLGCHKHSHAKLIEKIKFFLPNLLIKNPSKKQIERNTMAYLKAMDKHRINVLAHLGYAGCRVDCERLAIECAKRNIYIEFNGKRINFTKSDIEKMLKTDVKFIINSDAHNPLNVGRNHRAFNLIEKYKIPLDRIVNIDGRIPEFHRGE